MFGLAVLVVLGLSGATFAAGVGMMAAEDIGCDKESTIVEPTLSYEEVTLPAGIKPPVDPAQISGEAT